MQVDFLIVGQGLAGSLLAQELRRRGRKVHVVDDGWKSASSQVAAGLMTPLTGRRFTLTKDYPELFAAAKERLTERGVFRSTQVYRMFVDEEQRGKGLKRTECRSCQPFIERVTSAQGELDPTLTDTFGGALMNGAWVDLPKLLADVRAELLADGSLTEAAFDPAEAVADAEGITWRALRAGAIVYCDGYKSAQRGPFKYLPWQPAKGEALTLRASVADKPYILNREGWALPLGQGVWRTGANWQWDQLDETPTEPQKEKFIRRFRGYFGAEVQVEVTAHVAGVRPCTSDNHPFMGTHPQQPRTHLFGGLGPRGTVWAPLMADEMASYLCEGRPLRPECNLTRFAYAG
ncbi:MAG: FAD-dependent oxidoreductase [Verrucomicrobia bacterium]|jgi:glycine/D-amino acid oxidase-like deaminating enzyme|nr:MAG: FAD-dependent oxidoreductase [Verrucomicrobiota bacterium]